MHSLVFLTLVSAAFCASLSNREPCPQGCFENYKPVCGSNGHTYPNMCYYDTAHCHDNSILLAHEGPCGNPQVGRSVRQSCPNICPAIYAPLCGSDNKTYSNSCILKATNCKTNSMVTVAHDGPCDGDVIASK